MLWMITDFRKSNGVEGAVDDISRVVEAGVERVLFRNEEFFSRRELMNIATTLKFRYSDLTLVFQSDPTLVESAGFGGVHMKGRDLELVGPLAENWPDIPISVATHSEPEVDRAFVLGADSVLFSPIFRPYSKEKDPGFRVEPIARDGVYLLGGIDRSRAELLIGKGFTNLAGITLFYGKDAVRDVTYLSRLIEEVDNGKAHSD